MKGTHSPESDLPSSWTTASFNELDQFTSRTVDPSSRPDEVFELYSVPSFPNRRPERLQGREIGSTKQTVNPGDVLVCKINPRINRVWTVDQKGELEQIASSEWIGFRSTAIRSAFARHYFSSPNFRELLCSEVTGVGGSLTRAQPKKVAEYPVPVAPINEQTRIENKLDALLVRIQACNACLDAIPPLTKRFRQAVLGAATSGELTVDWRDHSARTSWRPSTVGEVLDGKPRNGYSPKAVEFETSVRSLTLSATTSGRFLAHHTKFIDEAIPAESHLWLEPGDILIQRANSLEYVGVSAVFDGPRQKFIYPDLMMKCRPNERVHGQYLFYALSSGSTRKYFRENATGTAGNMPKINQQTVMSAPIELPPMGEQVEIVRRVEALFKIADCIEARHKAAVEQAQRLAPLTLAKAFRGELVPQDPTDEPAGALLTRVAARRATSDTETLARQTRRARAPRGSKEVTTMTKSRQDDDVMGQPYLSRHLRRLGASSSAEALFKVSELPVADFYKQLAWEVAQGHVKDKQELLEPGDAS